MPPPGPHREAFGKNVLGRCPQLRTRVWTKRDCTPASQSVLLRCAGERRPCSSTTPPSARALKSTQLRGNYRGRRTLTAPRSGRVEWLSAQLAFHDSLQARSKRQQMGLAAPIPLPHPTGTLTSILIRKVFLQCGQWVFHISLSRSKIIEQTGREGGRRSRDSRALSFKILSGSHGQKWAQL